MDIEVLSFFLRPGVALLGNLRPGRSTIEWAAVPLRVVPIDMLSVEWARIRPLLHLTTPEASAAEVARMALGREWSKDPQGALRGVAIAFDYGLSLARQRRLPFWLM